MDIGQLILSLSSSGIIAAVLGYMIGKKKNDADIEKTEEETEALRISNLKNTIEIYKQVHNELSEQLKNVSDKCTQLSEEIAALREENKGLSVDIANLSEENKLLKKELHAFKQNLKK